MANTVVFGASALLNVSWLALVSCLAVYVWKTAVKKDRNPWPWLFALLFVPFFGAAVAIRTVGPGTYSLRKAQRARMVGRSR